MKLNHLNLTVPDVGQTKEFLQNYFGFRAMEGGPSNDNIALLFDDANMVLTLMKAQGTDEVSYPTTFHIGFIQESEAKVDEINQRLKDDGFDVKPARRFHGSWTFYLKSPGGFLVEVLC